MERNTINSSGLGSSTTATSAAPSGVAAPRKVLVPRPLRDHVQLSRESTPADEDAGSELCSNFMAAWG